MAATTSTVAAITTAQNPPLPPTEFLCPLSHKIMTDPVVTVHGINFQRDAILTWMSSEQMDCDYCPFSGKPMSLQDIIPNYSLQTKIQLWLEDQQQQNSGCCGDSRDGGEEKEEEEQEEDDVVDDEVEYYLRKRGIVEKNIIINKEDFYYKTNTEMPPIQDIEFLPMKEIEFTTTKPMKMKPKLSLLRISSLKKSIIPTSFFRINNKTST